MASDFDEVFDHEGNLVSRTERPISAEDEADRAIAERLRTAFVQLRTIADDERAIADAWPGATNAQKDAANRQLHTRFAGVCDGLADLLRYLAADR